MTNFQAEANQKSMLVDEFLPPMNRWIVVSNLVLVAGVCSAFLVSSVAKYNVIVKTEAVVRPVGELKIIQPAIQGSIQRIAVRENLTVSRGGEIATIDPVQFLTQQSQLEGRIRQARSQIAQIQAEMESNQTAASVARQEAQSEIQFAQAELTAAENLAQQGAVAGLVVQQKRQAYEAARAKLQQIQPSLDQQTATLNRNRIELQNQIEQDQKEIQQVKEQLEKTKIISPVDGVVQRLNLRNVGQFVQPGEEIAQISPRDSALVVKARVPIQDIRKVKICRDPQVEQCTEGKTELQVTAFPYPDYGTLKGAVREISPDAITPQRGNVGNPTEADSTSYYEVTIEIAKPYFEVKENRYSLKPGMSVNASIISEEETLLSFIMRKARLLADT